MNSLLLAAALIAIATVLVHSILGEWLIIGRLQAKLLPSVRGSRTITLRTLRFAWHITTVLGLGIALILLHQAKLAAPDVFVLRCLMLTFFASFLVALLGSRARHPSWIAFIAMAVLVKLAIP